MILAAGLGERMRPLTNHTPKPLLEVGGKALIVYHIEKLAAAGFSEIIINIAHLGFMIPETLGNGSKWGIKISYSDEQDEGALESLGGIVKALPLLGKKTFLVVNADVWCDYSFDTAFDLQGKKAHLILVDNPEHNVKGDFGLENGCAISHSDVQYTFSGIGYYDPKMFASQAYGSAALAPLLRENMVNLEIGATHYKGIWRDVGTPERLKELN